ncbi:MAG: hypothetical protein QM802_21170 [Agriterribacter sp.]
MIKNVPSLLRVCFVIAVCLISAKSYSQYKFFGKPVYEIGLNAGPSNLLGDLGGNKGIGTTFIKDNNIQTTKFMKGLYLSVRPSEFIGFSLSGNYTTLEGADSLIKNKGGAEVARKDRNLSVRTKLQELTLTTEIYPTVLFEQDDKDLWHKFRPYGIIGVGVFHFNPQAAYTAPNGVTSMVDLQPLRTEGQGMPQYPGTKPYSLTQINIPYGVGIRYYFSDIVSASFELVNRKTFTDYIDDVSDKYISDADFDSYFGAGSNTATIAKQMHNKAAQVSPGVRIANYNAGDKRGTVSNKDSYYSGTLKISIRLSRDHSGEIGCPMRF